MLNKNKKRIKHNKNTLVRIAGWFKLSNTLLICLTFLSSFYSYAESYDVKSITTIKHYGKDLDWSSSRDLIITAKIGADGYYDVFVMKPDGSEEKNLTHNKPGCPQKHNGNVVWHPSEDFIVFTAQNKDTPSNKILDKMAIPGIGLNCNLWITRNDGSRFWQMTNYPTDNSRNAKGVIHPQFSHDGKKLFWTERLGSGRNEAGVIGDESGAEEEADFKNMNFREKIKFLRKRKFGKLGQRKSGDKQDDALIWGEWVLKVADFIADPDNPRLVNIKTYQPGQQHAFYESHDFSSDDRKVLFSGNLMKGQPVTGLDIYEMDLQTQKLTRLTSSFEDWDEHAHYSSDGKKIIWMSSQGFDIQYGSKSGTSWGKYLKSELCIMNSDGSNKRRITHFNEPGYPEYMDGARCIVADSALSPDGSKIAATVMYERNGNYKVKIVIIEFERNEDVLH